MPIAASAIIPSPERIATEGSGANATLPGIVCPFAFVRAKPVKLARPSMLALDAAFAIRNGAVPDAEMLPWNKNGTPYVKGVANIKVLTDAPGVKVATVDPKVTESIGLVAGPPLSVASSNPLKSAVSIPDPLPPVTTRIWLNEAVAIPEGESLKPPELCVAFTITSSNPEVAVRFEVALEAAVSNPTVREQAAEAAPDMLHICGLIVEVAMLIVVA
jgi:hypothetical protein